MQKAPQMFFFQPLFQSLENTTLMVQNSQTTTWNGAKRLVNNGSSTTTVTFANLSQVFLAPFGNLVEALWD